VYAQIDEALRDKAAAMEKALPSQTRIPNKLTAQTLTKSERGEDLHSAENTEALFKELGI
jgi:DNA-damage-inducible protein J